MVRNKKMLVAKKMGWELQGSGMQSEQLVPVCIKDSICKTHRRVGAELQEDQHRGGQSKTLLSSVFSFPPSLGLLESSRKY
jgi:hypothetical protein